MQLGMVSAALLALWSPKATVRKAAASGHKYTVKTSGSTAHLTRKLMIRVLVFCVAATSVYYQC